MTSMTWAQFEARVRFLLGQLSAEVANRDWRAAPQPWSQFADRFTLPRKDLTALSNRIVLNSHIYQANYCIILGAALLYYVVRHPSSVFVVGGVIVAWVYATSPAPVVISGRRVTRKEKFLAVSLLSLFILVVSGVLMSFINVIGVSFLLVLLHAAFRHTSVRTKVGEIRTHMADRW